MADPHKAIMQFWLFILASSWTTASSACLPATRPSHQSAMEDGRGGRAVATTTGYAPLPPCSTGVCQLATLSGGKRNLIRFPAQVIWR